MSQGVYDPEEWQPTRWHVYLCDIQGYPQEELVDVEFNVEMQLNQIPTCNVSVTGKKFGYFRPWLHTIAVTGDHNEETIFFGPILNTRAQVANAAEYAVTTELDCQGWEAWLDRIYPMVEFFSEPGGPDNHSAYDAVVAIWDGVDAREKRFQVHPAGAIQRPDSKINAAIGVTLDWDTVSEETRPGAPTAWGMHQDIHAQGIDVSYRPTWNAASKRFYSRCVIGGSTNPLAGQMSYPKTGTTLGREFVVGHEASSMTLEMRGDMQATSVLATGIDSAYGLDPRYGALTLEDAALPEATLPKDVFAGLLLEYQYPADIQTINADDPDAACVAIAKAQRDRLRCTPLLINELQIRWKPGEVKVGDIIKVTDNGGAQIVDRDDAGVYSQLVRWEVTGRVAGISVNSADMTHASVSIFEVNDPGADTGGGIAFAAFGALDAPVEMQTQSAAALSASGMTELTETKASLSSVSFEQSIDNLTADVERLLLQRGTSGGVAGSVPTGSIVAYAGETIPDGWLACYGQIIDRVQYARLFTALGTKYGAGNGATTFGIPDLRSRFIWGAGTTPLGEVGGSFQIQANNLPPHAHAMGHTHTSGTPQSAEHKHDLAATSWARRYAVYPGSVEAPTGAPAPTNAAWGSGFSPAGSAGDRVANGTHSGGAHDHGTLTSGQPSSANTSDNTTSHAGFMPLYYALYYIIKAT